MNTRPFSALIFLVFVLTGSAAAPSDPLGRSDPRGTVTGFLEACHQHDYSKAAQYLDLSHIPARLRAQQGPQLAVDLESILNADSHFDVLQLSQDEQGDLSDDPDQNVEHVATVTSNGQTATLELTRETGTNAAPVWVFSSNSVAELPKLAPVSSAESAIEARLPRFLVTVHFLDTPLWKWLVLLGLAAIVALICRSLVRILRTTLLRVETHYKRRGEVAWLQALLDPLLVLLAVTVFRILEELVNPSALGRLYIGRCLLMVVVLSLAWSLINLFDLFLTRLDLMLSVRQRLVARSLIYLARRVGKALVIAFAAIVVLDNWDIKMTTIIAGLGVGGIAVALAAQQTIANVFAGVSVISDSPVMIGDFGNFGGVLGNVEEIGMRSARVRTLSRTVMSIPNSSFAGMNLENYAVRDKILFNPTFTIKRSTPKDQIRQLMKALQEMLSRAERVEIGPTPIRISAYGAAAFTIEVFAYVLTTDIDEYYKHEAELFLALDDVVTSSGVELV
jgi:MscS family membrane protein